MNYECKAYYEKSYESSGFEAQRRYPNEELMRFMGRNFFSVGGAKRKGIRILEVGCCSCGNLWAIAGECFDSYGLDFSGAGINLCQRLLGSWGCTRTLQARYMAELPFLASSFDARV